ncbi:MAG TPA: tRNA1(Val) (adenine(37)-N6)-methyltransferase [Candidatus Acidoferrales bacterium]|nr:tRNA1(Val) (adenine(37)-N6)-methyltransferase [Candidatus Acidoferrales bacterium]
MTIFPRIDGVSSGATTRSVATNAPGCQKADETFDTLFGGNLKFLQSRSGYRVSVDAVLLACFATARKGKCMVELGCGNGVVPLILAYLHPSIDVVGIEIQQLMAERAWRNVQLNGFDNRVRIIRGDIRAIRKIAPAESFDAVVCNPPYRRPDSGRISPNKEKQIARHECEGNLDDFIAAGAYLLPVKGRMAVIYSAVRAIDLIDAMRRARIEPKRLRMVHSFAEAEASLILVEGVKGGKSGVEVLAPLVVYERNKKYTTEMEAMLAGAPMHAD